VFARLWSAANRAEPDSSHFFITASASDPDTDAARQATCAEVSIYTTVQGQRLCLAQRTEWRHGAAPICTTPNLGDPASLDPEGQTGDRNVRSDYQPHIQIVGGAIGGNAVGGLFKNIVLSPLFKTISGAVGGGIGGTILQSLIPTLGGAASGGVDIGTALGNAAGGGITGAIVTAAVGLIKNALFKKI
jgi:hypothetical protein